METVCCVCARIKRGSRWINGEPRPGLAVSHGFCPACYQALIRRIEFFGRGRGRGLTPAA